MTAFRTEWLTTNLPRPPLVIFDVGTYDAADAIMFKRRWPNALVVAFEACPDNYANIQARGAAKEADVLVVNRAVCDETGVRPFHSNKDSRNQNNEGMSGSLHAPTEKLKRACPNFTFREPRDVLTTRLDDFCRLSGIIQIDFLHMDVQGGEHRALLGLGDLRPAAIFLEIDETAEAGDYEGAGSLVEIEALLRSWGYRKAWDNRRDAFWVLIS